MKEAVDNAGVALAKRLVVITKKSLRWKCWNYVIGFQVTAMESHSCRGYRFETRSVPRPQDSSEARP